MNTNNVWRMEDDNQRNVALIQLIKTFEDLTWSFPRADLPCRCKNGRCEQRMHKRCWRGLCIGNRADPEPLAVSNLAYLIFQLMASELLFSSRWARAFAVLDAFQSVLVSPGENVRHRRLGMPEKMWDPLAAENRPNVLDETIDKCFSPGATDLKLLNK
jgi:hypothetical protein